MVSWKRPFGPHCAVTHIVASKLPRMVGSVRAVLRAHQSTRALRRGALFCQFACFPWPRAAVPAKAWEFHSLVPAGSATTRDYGLHFNLILLFKKFQLDSGKTPQEDHSSRRPGWLPWSLVRGQRDVPAPAGDAFGLSGHCLKCHSLSLARRPCRSSSPKALLAY